MVGSICIRLTFLCRNKSMSNIDKIICVGKNYLEHAKELDDAIPKKPVIFLKPPSILRQAKMCNETLALSLSNIDNNVHYECEVVLSIQKGGYKMSVAQAKEAIGAVTIGL